MIKVLIKDLVAEVEQSAQDLETAAKYAINTGNWYLGQMFMAQAEESRRTIERHKGLISEATK